MIILCLSTYWKEGIITQPIKVLLVDDQKLFRESLAPVLEIRNPNIKVVAQAANGEEGWQLAVKHCPDVILMDVRMPVMDGVESAHRVRAKCPEAKIIMLTTFSDDEYLFDALKLGVSGYLLKDIPPTEVESAILSVFNGGVLISPDMTVKVVNRLNTIQGAESERDLVPMIQEVLTPREYDVFRLIALGYDNKKIAEKLYLIEGTVRNHVSNIYSKLDLHDRVQIVKYAIEHGVI